MAALLLQHRIQRTSRAYRAEHTSIRDYLFGAVGNNIDILSGGENKTVLANLPEVAESVTNLPNNRNTSIPAAHVDVVHSRL